MDDKAKQLRLKAEIVGDVQGVGFRLFAEREARRRSLRGYVRNRDDGAVEVEAEGSSADLEALLDALRRGPRMARVEHVRVAWSAFKGDLGPFGVRG